MAQAISRWNLAQKATIARALMLHRGNVSAAARWLGLGRATVYVKMQALGLNRQCWRSAHRPPGFWEAVKALGVNARPKALRRMTNDERISLLAACKVGWRLIAKRTHPDVAGDAERERFIRAREAWSRVRQRLT